MKYATGSLLLHCLQAFLQPTLPLLSPLCLKRNTFCHTCIILPALPAPACALVLHLLAICRGGHSRGLFHAASRKAMAASAGNGGATAIGVNSTWRLMAASR